MDVASATVKPGMGRSDVHRVRVQGDGVAIVVPDPVVPFRDASFVQSTDVVLDAGASLVLCDVLTAGRVAFGERWNATTLDGTLSIERAGTKLLHDRVLLGADAASRMRRFEAIGTAILLGPRVADLAATELARIAAEPLARGAQVIACASPLGDGAIVRVAGERVEDVVRATRTVLTGACARLGEDPWSRKW